MYASSTTCGSSRDAEMRHAAEPQNSAFDLKIATLSSKLGSLFEASWRDGSH